MASNRVRLEKDLANADPASFTADEVSSYGYDANDRLRWELFDAAGTSNDTNTVYTYGANNAWTLLTAKRVREGLVVGSGNPLDFDENYQYDLEGRLSAAQITSGLTTRTHTYQYNHEGHRVRQTEQVSGGPVTTTVYHVDPHNPTGYAQVLEEGVDANGDGTLQAAEIDRSYTLGHDVVAQAAANGTVDHFLYDGHGSTRALVTETGAIHQRYAFDAWGQQ
ncbi:MAG TPA: hypothetical protein PKC18_18925 [Lacipirellulaceae bacterium]|nr:hypothetical protein [Lacipirellulaceae bacterium]